MLQLVFLTFKRSSPLTKHTQLRGGVGGGVVEQAHPPKVFETIKDQDMPFDMQLVLDLLINSHSNNHHQLDILAVVDM